MTLLAYNITVRRQNALEFFGRELGPIDHLDSNLLSTIYPSTSVGLSLHTLQFLGCLEVAMRVSSDEKRPVNNLAQSVLQVTGFQERETILLTRYEIPFTVCSDPANAAKIGVCLMHLLSSMILVIVQADSTGQSSCEAEAHVIAEAIAAFQHNNKKRLDLGLQSLESMTIPCITMVGRRPFFYKVPVTIQLSNAVASGKYPQPLTIVVLPQTDDRQLTA